MIYRYCTYTVHISCPCRKHGVVSIGLLLLCAYLVGSTFGCSYTGSSILPLDYYRYTTNDQPYHSLPLPTYHRLLVVTSRHHRAAFLPSAAAARVCVCSYSCASCGKGRKKDRKRERGEKKERDSGFDSKRSRRLSFHCLVVAGTRTAVRSIRLTAGTTRAACLSLSVRCSLHHSALASTHARRPDN